MFTHADTVGRRGAEGRRDGDVVVRHDQDHGFGRGYRFFFSSRRRHTRCVGDWSSDVCSPDLQQPAAGAVAAKTTQAPTINAPLTGIFYRSPSPQAQAYVQVGSTVGVGEVIGLIEAMKLFNEIHATASGRVSHIFIENGQLVRAHQPLVELEPV